MSVEHVTDHEDQGVALLVSQFRNKPLIEILVRALMEQVQDLEDALWDLLVNRAIDTADGAQLVVIGKIVGQPQGTFDQDTYRTWIKARVLVNRSSGTVDDMVAIVNAVLPTGATMRVTEYYPAAFVIEVTSSVPDWFGQALAGIVRDAKALGVSPRVKWFNGVPFRFAPAAGAPEAGSGFGEGVWSAGSRGVGPVNVAPAFDFSDPNNSQYVGL